LSAPEKPESLAPPPAPAEQPQMTAEPKKPSIEEVLAQMQNQQAQMQAQIAALAVDNKKSIDLMASAIVKLNEKIEAKGSNPKGEGTSDWIEVLKDLAGAGKPSSLEDAAKNVAALTKFAEAMDRFRHPFDYEGAVAKRLLWRQGMRSGGLPRYMTKEELKRYDKYLDQSLGLEEEGEEGEEHPVSE